MTGSGPVALERRAHPRVPHRSPVDIVTEGQPNPIAASTVDVSLGGMRVTSTDPVPVGPCTIELGSVALVGEVLGQIIDVESGQIVSRIKFSEVPPAAHDHLAMVTATAATPMAPPAAAVAAVPTRRFYAGIVAAAVLVIAVVAVALIARGGSSSDDADSSLASTSDDIEQEAPTADSTSADDEVEASADDPATDPATDPAVDPSTDVAPSPETDPDPAPAPAGSDPAPAPAPSPALVTRTETADNGVQVELAEDPSQTAVASTVGPSTGVDQVKIQLDVIPEQDGTTLPVAVVIENRGDKALEFADGLTTTVTFTGADGVAHDVVLRAADVTQLAPGERHELLGSIDFGGYGRFDVTATTPVGERA